MSEIMNIEERGIPFETLCEIGKDRIGDIENLEVGGVKE